MQSLDQMKAALDEAIAQEDYAEAARLRDALECVPIRSVQRIRLQFALGPGLEATPVTSYRLKRTLRTG